MGALALITELWVFYGLSPYAPSTELLVTVSGGVGRATVNSNISVSL